MAKRKSNSSTAYRPIVDSSPGHKTPEANSSSPSKSPATSSRRGPSLEILNENSPLLSPQHAPNENGFLPEDGIPVDTLDWTDKEDVEKSKSVWYLFLLTLSIGGLQIAWAVELSYGSPYLLELGMNKSLLAFVWIAGPLSGTLVQPYVGIRSDNCRISWGKRKPFMLAGAAATIFSLLGLAWTREIVRGFLHVFGAGPESDGVKWTAICFAVLFVYILDFAINTVQAGIRAFIVDNAPTHQQEDANAWAGRITGVGNVLGYLAGYIELPKIMPIFGNTQFKVLCVIASFALGVTVVISCLCIQEHDPRLEGPPDAMDSGLLSFFRQVIISMRRLPPSIRMVCTVQFFAWMGWFPFLFYITTYIGQLYVNPIFEVNPRLPSAEVDETWRSATRIGTFSLLIFAITSFASNILLPFIIAPTYQAPPASTMDGSRTTHRHPSTPGTPGTVSMTSFFAPTPSAGRHSRLARLLSICQIKWLTLRRAWLLSHVLYAVCMFGTFFVRTPLIGTVLVGMVGIPWALTLWAPFALISAEISKRETARRARNGAATGEFAEDLEGPAKGNQVEDQAGVILGLHNVAIAAPQIIATLLSSAIFKLTQKPRGVAGDDSVGWVLRLGGVAALVAAYMATRVPEEAASAKGVDDDEPGAGSV